MGKFIFEMNHKVDIVWDDGIYRSQVQDIEEGIICISVPMKEGRYLPLEVGLSVDVLYYDKKDVYEFITVVVARKIEQIPIILLKIPEKIKKIQRRNCVRVNLMKFIKYTKINEKMNVEKMISINPKLFNFKEAALVDLSAGGMRIKIEEEIRLGENIVFFLPLPSEEMLIKGKVVRLEKDSEKRNICGVSFMELDRKQIDLIMQYLFQLMREQRKKDIKEE